tara:strand:+ start:107 stop:448 length:342 start_codon:yes stop_codon:yes gene_type:complete
MKDKNITTNNKSIITKLKDQNKINDSLLIGISSLSLEELIAVKLELAAEHINNRLYGFDIWRKANYIVRDAILKFAISTTKSKKDAARFLGITPQEFQKTCRNYKIDDYFKEN